MAKKKVDNFVKDIDLSLIDIQNKTDVYIGELAHSTIYGMQKIVVVFDDLDYVYKINIGKSKDYSIFFDTIKNTILEDIFIKPKLVLTTDEYTVYTQPKCTALFYIEEYKDRDSVDLIPDVFKAFYNKDISDFVCDPTSFSNVVNKANCGILNDKLVVFSFDYFDRVIDFINDNKPVFEQ